jgi:hypothetical protein
MQTLGSQVLQNNTPKIGSQYLNYPHWPKPSRACMAGNGNQLAWDSNQEAKPNGTFLCSIYSAHQNMKFQRIGF